VKAVVLVGGLGTRLRPLTFAVPKPLLAVGDKPMLQLILEQLRDANVTEIVLATGYLAPLIEAFCGDGSRFGVKVSYVRETEPLGTAGPLSLLRDRVARDELLVLMNGDIVTRARFAEMIEFARAGGFELTVGYVDYVYKSPFGVLTVEGDEVVGIAEKPRVDYRVSAGVYVVRGSALALVPDRAFFTVPDLIAAVRARGRPVGAYHIREFWLGVEDLTDIEAVGRLLREGEAGAAGPGTTDPVR
jgi:NDP-sugar pyrophosphorylase family protein